MSLPTALPVHPGGVKCLWLIRHGQAVHNVAAARVGRAAYENPEFRDAELTEEGRAQARHIRANAGVHGLAEVQLVLTSPLHRACETAMAIFEAKPGSDSQPASAPPCLAVEMAREAYGIHFCDSRRSVSELSLAFPSVDFSLVGSDEDTWWQPDVRETLADVARRARKLLQFIWTLQATHIAIVSHGVFLETLLSAATSAHPSLTQHRFGNAEVRVIALVKSPAAPEEAP